MKFLKLKNINKRFTAGELCARHVLSVGIISGCHGTGVTHLALMAANYYANGKGYRTAVAECSEHKDFMRICDETNNMTEDMRHFSYGRVDYCTCCSAGELSRLFTGRYEAVVCDMAVETEENFAEFIRCDVRVVVCSTALYKIGRTRKLLQKLNGISVIPVAFAADIRKKRMLEKEYNIKIAELPIETNPLRMASSTLEWMHNYFPG